MWSIGQIGQRRRGLLIGATLVVAIGAVSASALVFQGRDDTSSSLSSKPSTSATTRHGATTTSSSTTTTSTTTSTTTTTAPPPPPTEPPVTEAPAPVAEAPAPAPVFTPPPAPVVSFCDGSGSAVISAMNGDRGANGLGALCGNSQLQGIAQNWANWMAQNASLTHQDLGAAIGNTSFSAMAENILEGPGGMSVDQMESAWMGSAPHRANILSGAYSAAGVGIAYSSDGRVWVAVDFGG
jgi:uncharacterized protein YkwD